ncbi:hypothetical protein EJB05_53546, partial [Eragrostis curvula]
MSQDVCSTQPPPAKSQKKSSPAPIDSLSEDLLLEIFLRLPSLATLIGAALTCRAWRRAVASSPSFRRRFRELHEAPLLGVFADPSPHTLPVFAPAHHRDADMLAAIRLGDFALTSVLDSDGFAGNLPVAWRVFDCREGHLVLMNWEAWRIAVVNPLSRCDSETIPMPPIEQATEGHSGQNIVIHDLHLLHSVEDPTSLRLLCIFLHESRVRVAVFSSDTWDWRFHPWVEIPERTQPVDANECWLYLGTQANGFVYYPFWNREHVLTLDTATMKFSVLKLSQQTLLIRKQVWRAFVSSTMALLASFIASGCSLVADEDGVETWVPGRKVQYEEAANPPENNEVLKIMAVNNGFVYLTTSTSVLSLCFETMKLEKLFPRSFWDHSLYPYVMAWPPSLVGNYGSFAAMQDGAN